MPTANHLGGAVPAGPLQRVGAAELIAGHLREAIMSGDLRPGTPLREHEVADRFGVARNTIREALKILVRTGLASHEVHHGVAVRKLSAADVDNIYGLRTLLEEKACGRAGQLTADETAALRSAVDTGGNALASGDFWGALGANQDFHRAIVALLGNPRADALLDALLAESILGLVLEDARSESSEKWLQRNRELLALLIAGPSRRCVASVREYLDESRRHVRDLVRVEPT